MNIGEVNKGAIALIMVLLIGAGGFLWYSRMYSPAVEARTLAQDGATAAEATLATAKQELAAAQQQVEDSKKESAKLDDSVHRLAKARTAIPSKDQLDDAALVLVELAGRSGVETNFKAGNEDQSASAATDAGALQGAVPVDLEFEAAGTYSEMMQFMTLVEDTVDERDGKLYTRGRLFNIVKLEIGEEGDDAGSGDTFGNVGGADTTEPDGLIMKPGDIKFTVVVRMYTSSTDNAESVGLTTPDPAASPTTDPNAAAGGAGTDPAAGGGAASTDPNATGGAPTGTDPAATGGGDPAAGTDPAATGGAGTTTPTGGGI